MIDKTAPVIDIAEVEDIDTKSSLTVTFTIGTEAAYSNDCGVKGKLYMPGEKISVPISKRGTYNFGFVDKAGNITVKTLEIKNIDVSNPVIMIMGENASTPVKGTHSFYATMNEEVTIAFLGKDYPVRTPVDKNNNGKYEVSDAGSLNSECDWITLSVTSNSSYVISCKDKAGRITYTYFTVSCIDNTAPAITFSSPTVIKVCQDTATADFEVMIMEGVSISDNVSPYDKLNITYTLLNEVQLKTVGSYMVEYTVSDEAGNVRKAVRNVTVYPKKELLVTINGKRAERKGTLVFGGVSNFNTNIKNLANGDNEPVKVYLRKGYYEEGQMKTAPIVGTQFTDLSNGYYTVYIVSQSRQTFLTYLFID